MRLSTAFEWLAEVSLDEDDIPYTWEEKAQAVAEIWMNLDKKGSNREYYLDLIEDLVEMAHEHREELIVYI